LSADPAGAGPAEPPGDEVVLLDDLGRPIGTALKSQVHGADTPLHQAFSVYLRNDLGEVLLTRRALTKLTWPGVWTGTCCGHPRPDEPIPTAVTRRLRDELGVSADSLTSLTLALADFRYRATSPEGVVENEICPVYLGVVDGRPRPTADTAEVVEWRWVSGRVVADLVDRAPFLLSPWAIDQIAQLRAFGLWP
jgi:isopentenyl-diphosphate delta-isomerase